MLSIFYLHISGELRTRISNAVVNKVYKIARSYQTGLELYVLLLTPCTESSEAEREKERAFVRVDPWLFWGSGWSERDEEVT